MQDNSTDNKAEMLIRYMDGEMNDAERITTERLLQEDAALQERYQYFLAAKKAVRSKMLKQRVQAVHNEYMQEVKTHESSATKVVKPRPIFKTIMSVAAVFIMAVVGYGTFQYVSTTNQSVYNDNFMAYQLPVNRSSEKANNLDALYNAGNYTAVINTFNAIPSKDQKAYFLAAQSYLQLNNPDAAINAFQQVENLNNKSTEKYFVQETDYYLALAYIKAGKTAAAAERLNKITANKKHLFYNKANQISRTKLMMLKWKEN